jgi:hypothetical protein
MRIGLVSGCRSAANGRGSPCATRAAEERRRSVRDLARSPRQIVVAPARHLDPLQDVRHVEADAARGTPDTLVGARVDYQQLEL